MNFLTVAAFELARPGGRLVVNSVRYLIGPSSNLARELRRSSLGSPLYLSTLGFREQDSEWAKTVSTAL